MGYFVLMALAMILFIVAVGAIIVARHEKKSILPGVAGAFVVLIVGAGITLFAGFRQIDPVTVGVLTNFGHVTGEVLPEGLHVILPWESVNEVSVNQQIINDDEHSLLTKDGTSLPDVSAAFVYENNPEVQAAMYEHFKGKEEQKLLVPAAKNALHQAISKYTWEEITASKRDDVIRDMTMYFKQYVRTNLQEENNLSQDVIDHAYTIPDVQLQNVTLPEKILNSSNEFQAAQIDLSRRKTMTEIAQADTNIQQQQGEGIKKLFDQLPKGYSAQDVKDILTAISAKENADALMKAVENNKINTIVIPSGNPVAVSAN